MKKQYFLFVLLGSLGFLGACRKDSADDVSAPIAAPSLAVADERTGPPTNTNHAYEILNGTTPVSAVYRYRRGGEGGTPPLSILQSPAPGYNCRPAIRVNNAATLSAETQAWGIGVVRLDNNLTPISEALYGDCPNCLPLDANNSFSWLLPAPFTRWDIFLIQFGSPNPLAEVTESFPCNGSDPGGNDTYGDWSVDLHQFNTWMGCADCP